MEPRSDAGLHGKQTLDCSCVFCRGHSSDCQYHSFASPGAVPARGLQDSALTTCSRIALDDAGSRADSGTACRASSQMASGGTRGDVWLSSSGGTRSDVWTSSSLSPMGRRFRRTTVHRLNSEASFACRRQGLQLIGCETERMFPLRDARNLIVIIFQARFLVGVGSCPRPL